MKKRMAMLTAILMAAALMGCGNKTESAAPAPESTVESEAEEEVEEEADEDEDFDDEAEVPSYDVNFDEPVVLTAEDVTLTISGARIDEYDYYQLKTLVENNGSTECEVNVLHAVVNGIEVYPVYDEYIAAGESINEPIEFYREELTKAGIEEYTDIMLEIEISDEETESVGNFTIHVYPLGEDKAGQQYTRPDEDTDVLVTDNDLFKMAAISFGVDDVWGYLADFYFENKTDQTLTFEAKDVTVNGVAIDPYFYQEVAAGAVADYYMVWNTADLEENEIDTVEEIKFILSVTDEDGNEVYVNAVQLNP
ncbi:MAG: hypothetical protein KBS83_08790 [Lachnospiraceae bacterium]|nr:hypothetical protein [Candidatus Equihabitans merdae]